MSNPKPTGRGLFVRSPQSTRGTFGTWISPRCRSAGASGYLGSLALWLSPGHCVGGSASSWIISLGGWWASRSLPKSRRLNRSARCWTGQWSGSVKRRSTRSPTKAHSSGRRTAVGVDNTVSSQGTERSLKTEAMRVIAVPFSLEAMRAELVAFVRWYDAYRPHQSFGGRTPAEVYEGRERADQRTGTGSTGRLTSGRQVALDVSYLEGRQHLPIVELMPAA